MSYYAGIDLGGTKIAAGILDSTSGELIVNDVIPTQAQAGPAAVMQRTAALVRELTVRAGVTLQAAGMGVPAVVDYEGGRTLLMPNLPGWHGRTVAAELAELLGVPGAIINDARAFTLAEATLGAGKGAAVVACFTIGTGIGGGIAINGKLHMGLDGAAGEFGHQTIAPDGAVCGCGNRGCLEAVASGKAIINAALKAVDEGGGAKILAAAGGDRANITPDTLLQAILQGDGNSGRILFRVGEYLGIGISNVVTMFGADCVIIGGGVARLGDWLLNPVREVMIRRCTCTNLAKVKVTVGALGDHAGVMGAALWAAQKY